LHCLHLYSEVKRVKMEKKKVIKTEAAEIEFSRSVRECSTLVEINWGWTEGCKDLFGK